MTLWEEEEAGNVDGSARKEERWDWRGRTVRLGMSMNQHRHKVRVRSTVEQLGSAVWRVLAKLSVQHSSYL